MIDDVCRSARAQVQPRITGFAIECRDPLIALTHWHNGFVHEARFADVGKISCYWPRVTILNGSSSSGRWCVQLRLAIRGTGLRVLSFKKLSYGLQYVLVLAIVGFFYVLPTGIASNAGAVFGQIAGLILQGGSRRAIRQIAAAFPELSEREHKKICQGMWRNLGRITAEYSHLPKMLEREKRRPGRYFEIYDQEDALTQVKDGQPAIFASAHFGNWEVIGAISHLWELNSYAFGRPLNNPYVESLLVRFRTKMGLKLLAKGTGTDGVRRLFAALREKAVVGMLVDQAQRGGVHSMFFGREVRTSPAFLTVSQHLGVPVFPLLVTRVRGCRFRVDILRRLKVGDSGDRQADIEAATRQYDAWLEERVRQHPEQWLWLHRRWKTWPRQEKREAERKAHKQV